MIVVYYSIFSPKLTLIANPIPLIREKAGKIWLERITFFVGMEEGFLMDSCFHVYIIHPFLAWVQKICFLSNSVISVAVRAFFLFSSLTASSHNLFRKGCKQKAIQNRCATGHEK